MRRFTAILSFLVWMLSGLPPALAQAAKADAMRARLEKMGKDFADAYNRGDAKAVAAFYAEDAVVLPPDSDFVKGRPAIEAAWKGANEAGMKNMGLEIVDVESDGTYVIETGKATADMQPAGQATAKPETYKYVVVWKKQKDGSWKIIRDIWNSVAAAAPAAHH
jgi:uncharacterized protein (TIGR02246 family)